MKPPETVSGLSHFSTRLKFMSLLQKRPIKHWKFNLIADSDTQCVQYAIARKFRGQGQGWGC
jgi:hypothetical protein